MGAGDTIPEDTVSKTFNSVFPPFGIYHELVSTKYQWLPADVSVDKKGKVEFLSYINNVHPEWHAPLYPATASLIERCIPLFERALAVAAQGVHRAIEVPETWWDPPHSGVAYEQKKRENPEFTDEEGLVQRMWEKERAFIPPTVPDTLSLPEEPENICLRGRMLQVCLRMINLLPKHV